MIRKRLLYFILIIIILIIGITTRFYPHLFPDCLTNFLVIYLGDTLWAATAYLVVCFICPSIKIKNALIISLAFCYLIEISQLYHAPWIDAVRANRFAALILGFGFLWSDFICYTIGVGLAVLTDVMLLRVGKRKSAEKSGG